MSSKYQQTIEWFNARCGCLTASMAGKVVPRQKSGKPYAAYAEALQDVLIERITGAPVEHFTTAAMQWGTEHEDDARAAYEEVTGTIVLDAPFVKHPTIPFFGASPDGFLDDGKGLLEIKCPCSSTHLARVREGIVRLSTVRRCVYSSSAPGGSMWTSSTTTRGLLGNTAPFNFLSSASGRRPKSWTM